MARSGDLDVTVAYDGIEVDLDEDQPVARVGTGGIVIQTER